MNKLLIATILLMGSLFSSCSKKEQSTKDILDTLYQKALDDSSPQSAVVYMDSLSAYVPRYPEMKSELIPYLVNGIALSEKHNLNHYALSFLMVVLRNNPDFSDRKSYVMRLAEILYKSGNQHAADAVWSSLNKQYPEDTEIQAGNRRMDSLASASGDYVQYLFEQVLVKPDNRGLNEHASQLYVDAVEAFALADPLAESVPQHLYRAAEVARQLNHLNKAMSIYDWILEDYPDFEKTPTVLFIKGFTLEEDYNDSDKALRVYEEFMRRFPDHQLAQSVQILIQNAGKSTEEILENIEAKNQNSQTPSNN